MTRSPDGIKGGPHRRRVVRRLAPGWIRVAVCLAWLVALSPGPGSGVPLIGSEPVSAATSVRFVSPTGSDRGPGTRERPWRTIQHAVDVAPAGTVIAVRGGRYAGFRLTRSGLRIVGSTGERAIVSGGLYVVYVRGVTSALLRNLVISGASPQWGAGIRVDDSSGVVIDRSVIRDNRSFGIKIRSSSLVTIRANDIFGNETGIELSGVGDSVVVTGNRIHDNDRMVTPTRGGNAIVFTVSTGRVTVSDNRIWGNRAPHGYDSGYDGGAFEVYASSNLSISGNLLWDNNNVMETGTNGVPCSGISFRRNVAYGAGRVPGETAGMILRCASASEVVQNTFVGLDGYAFYVTASGAFAGSIDSLTIADNIVDAGRTYSLDTGLPASLTIDRNLSHPGGPASYATHLAFVEGRGNTDRLTEFTTWTGYDRHGLQADPMFVAPSLHDYRLAAGSPAIDAGDPAYAPDGFVGAAPDLGRFEAPQ